MEELKVDFYERIRSQIKDYLPAEEYSEVKPEIKEIMGRVTLVVKEQMVDLEGYYDCYGEYCREFDIALEENSTVEWNENTNSLYKDFGEERGNEMTRMILPEISGRLQDSSYQEQHKKLVSHDIINNIIIEGLVKGTIEEKYVCQDVGIEGKSVIYSINDCWKLMPSIRPIDYQCIIVTNKMLEAYGFDKEQLYQIALQNTQKRYPDLTSEIKGLTECTEGGIQESKYSAQSKPKKKARLL